MGPKFLIHFFPIELHKMKSEGRPRHHCGRGYHDPFLGSWGRVGCDGGKRGSPCQCFWIASLVCFCGEPLFYFLSTLLRKVRWFDFVTFKGFGQNICIRFATKVFLFSPINDKCQAHSRRVLARPWGQACQNNSNNTHTNNLYGSLRSAPHLGLLTLLSSGESSLSNSVSSAKLPLDQKARIYDIFIRTTW